MSHRVMKDVIRRLPAIIEINGISVEAFEGESIAAAIVAAGVIGMTRDRTGNLRGPFCNMGICADCIVAVEYPFRPGVTTVRVKSCMASVRAGIKVTVPYPPIVSS